MMNKTQTTELEKLQQEMRRGVIVLAVMSQLMEEQYGYSLIKDLSDKGLEIGQDTLYPLLRRLEAQELLDSEWRVEEPRPRRYYRLNDTGRSLLEQLKAEWRKQVEIIKEIIK
jgi:PadR family transcriptional regulator PadR